MRRIGVALAAVAAVLALTAGTLLAANPPGVTGTLNQNQEDISGGLALWDFHFALAQTFTPDVTGTLDAVGINISLIAPGPEVVRPAATGDLVIEVWNVTGGVPSGSPIVGESVNVVGQTGFVYFEIPSPPSVISGTPYAITVAGAGETIVDFPDTLNWRGDCAANYPGGQALVIDYADASPVWQTVPVWQAGHPSDAAAYCQQDFAFETYITAAPAFTPAPTLTPPPTSTTAPAGETIGGPSGAWLLFAGLAAAAAFVTMRRFGRARR